MLTLNLPFPVSVNAMYSNAGARVMIDPLHSPAVQEFVASLEAVK